MFNIFLVNQKYYIHLISLNVSQRISGLCQTHDAEIFTIIYWINTVNYFGKKLRVLMFDGVLNLSLHLPSVDFNQYVTRSHIVYTTIVSFQMNIKYQRKIKNRKKKIVLDRSLTCFRNQNLLQINAFQMLIFEQKTRRNQ